MLADKTEQLIDDGDSELVSSEPSWSGQAQSLYDVARDIALSLKRIAEALERLNVPVEQGPDGAPEESDAEEQFDESGTVPSALDKFLSARRITVKNAEVRGPLAEGETDVLDNIAKFMGERYPLIEGFLERIKRLQSTGMSTRYSLRDQDQAVVSATCQLAHLLYDIAFLSEFSYKKAPKYLLTLAPSRHPDAINFLTGKWLERYIRLKVVDAVNRLAPELPFSYLAGSQVILPNGDDFEIDLLAAVGEHIFWIEAKTGEDYPRYVEKYAKLQRIIDVDVFLVLAQVNSSQAAALSKLYGMTITTVEGFAEEFENHLRGIR